MAEDRVSLRQAMRSYSETMRSNKGKYGEGQGLRKAWGMVGEEVMGAAKYYKSAIEPNVKAWKDIESGYEELGIAEGKRWGDGKAPGFFQKMQSPEKYEIPEVQTGGYRYSSGSLQALGKAKRSPKAEHLFELSKSDKGFSQMFSIGKSPAVESMTSSKAQSPWNWRSKSIDREGVWNVETKEKMDEALLDQEKMDKAFLKLSGGKTLGDTYEAQDLGKGSSPHQSESTVVIPKEIRVLESKKESPLDINKLEWKDVRDDKDNPAFQEFFSYGRGSSGMFQSYLTKPSESEYQQAWNIYKKNYTGE